MQIVFQALCSFVYGKILAQLWILRGNAHRAFSVVADAVLLTADCYHSSTCYCDGIRTHCKCLDHFTTCTKASGNDELLCHVVLIHVCAGTGQGIYGRHCRIVFQLFWRCSGCATSTVYGNEVRLCICYPFQICFDMPGCYFYADRPSITAFSKRGDQLL